MYVKHFLFWLILSLLTSLTVHNTEEGRVFISYFDKNLNLSWFVLLISPRYFLGKMWCKHNEWRTVPCAALNQNRDEDQNSRCLGWWPDCARLMKINGNRLYIDERLTEIADWEERGPWTIDSGCLNHFSPKGSNLFLLFLFCKVGRCHSDDYYFSGPDKVQFQFSTELNRNRCSHRFDCGVIGVYCGSTFDNLGKLHPLGINSAVRTHFRQLGTHNFRGNNAPNSCLHTPFEAITPPQPFGM